MAKANFKRIANSSDIDTLPVEDGAFIVTGDGKSYVDYDENRISVCGTPDSEMSSTSTNTVQNNTIKAYVDNKTSPNILTAVLTANYTIQESGNYEQLPLGQSIKIGSKLSLNNSGGIVIGAGVNYIRVNSNVSYNSVASSGVKWNTIYKNNTVAYTCPIQASARVSIANTGGLIAVNEGDIIYLKVSGSTGDVIRSEGEAKYTYLTAEVVS